jgi:hypothetical protein
LLVKTPASCSAICQPSDTSSFFKASKKRLEYIPKSLRKRFSDGNLGEEDDELERDIEAVYGNKFVRGQLYMALTNTSYANEKKIKSLLYYNE